VRSLRSGQDADCVAPLSGRDDVRDAEGDVLEESVKRTQHRTKDPRRGSKGSDERG
jgi:hypothetical protein